MKMMICAILADTTWPDAVLGVGICLAIALAGSLPLLFKRK